jgi:hypothetical protein
MVAGAPAKLAADAVEQKVICYFDR